MKKNESIKKAFMSYFPFLLSSLLFIVSILSIFRGVIIKPLDFIQIINTSLEVTLFLTLAICLARSKNRAFSYLTTGYLLLIAFNIAHRFSYLTGYYSKSFDVAWFICFWFIIGGFFNFYRKKCDKIELLEHNSLHVLSSSIFILFSTLLFIGFIVLEFFITSLEVNTFSETNLLLKNIPGILIFTFTVSILASKFFSFKVSSPLEKVSERVDLLQDKKTALHDLKYENFAISEINKLDRFILNTINELHLANTVKSEFLMNMSHDFRTPATGVYSMAKLVYSRITDVNLKKLQKLVVDSSRQLIDLLDDVLDYSKLENDKTVRPSAKINLSELIHEVIAVISAKVEEKQLKIDCFFSDDSIIYYGDRVMLSRVILNILSNAVKFTHEGGITIKAEIKNFEQPKRQITIEIHDTGIGIDKKYHTSIFDPFVRIESAETSQYAGVGLGLSNVQLMLKKIGGTVEVFSELGKGSIFSVHLPSHSS